jgi:hypothetical protein
MRVPQNALNTAGPESEAASAELEAAKAVPEPLQPINPSERHPTRRMVVLQRSREILESERDWRVMEIPFGSVESGVVVGPGRGQALVHFGREFLS